MSTRAARVVRGLVVAVVALLVAAVAHIAGGGTIGPVGFVLAFTFSTLACIGLAGRTISRFRVSVAVLFSQGVFHLLFGVGDSGQSATRGHQLGMIMGDPGAAPLAGTGALAPTGMTDNPWMWSAHGFAAILTIVALVKGERAFWKLAGWVAHSLTAISAVPVLASAQAPVAPGAPVVLLAPGARFLVAGMRHRGPPWLAAFT